MFDFVPLDIYYKVYLNVSLIVVIFTLFHTYVLKINNEKNIIYTNNMGYFFLVLTIIYMGFRPVSGKYFGDMLTYNKKFLLYASGAPINTTQDLFFEVYMKFCSYFLSVRYFFLLCVIIYIIPLYRVSKAYFGKYWFYAFLMFTVSFSFWTYGTNGIRNGIATSLFLLGLSFYNKKKFWLIFFIVLSFQIHNSLMLPALALVASQVYSKSKTYLIFWLLTIPLSITMGSVWESLFSSLGLGDDRLTGYLSGAEYEDTSFSSTGFRYDFLVYSAAAVFTGWYFIFKKKFNDPIYIHIYNTYLICNAFWILVIKASFSNRFAYLSWFLMGLVIIYPFLKKDFFTNHHLLVGKVLTVYFMFTYFMEFLYY